MTRVIEGDVSRFIYAGNLVIIDRQEWSRLRKYRCDVFTARDRPISWTNAKRLFLLFLSSFSLSPPLSLSSPKFRHSSVSTVDNDRQSALIVIRAKNENLFSTR